MLFRSYKRAKRFWLCEFSARFFSNKISKVIYRFSSILRFTRSILKFQKMRRLVEVTQKIYNSSTLKSVSLKFYELMIGAKSVQAPIESCLEVCVVQKRNGSVYRVSYKLHSRLRKDKKYLIKNWFTS